jgi:hypothetical protein
MKHTFQLALLLQCTLNVHDQHINGKIKANFWTNANLHHAYVTRYTKHITIYISNLNLHKADFQHSHLIQYQKNFKINKTEASNIVKNNYKKCIF